MTSSFFIPVEKIYLTLLKECLIKHLEVRSKYYAAHCIFNFPLVAWKYGETWSGRNSTNPAIQSTAGGILRVNQFFVNELAFRPFYDRFLFQVTGHCFTDTETTQTLNKCLP